MSTVTAIKDPILAKKAQFFPDDTLRTRLNALSGVASNIREGSSGFTNPSGTAGSFAAYGIYSTPAAALGLAIAGQPAAGVALMVGAGASMAAARPLAVASASKPSR